MLNDMNLKFTNEKSNSATKDYELINALEILP